jgi:hypothetical protein
VDGRIALKEIVRRKPTVSKQTKPINIGVGTK